MISSSLVGGYPGWFDVRSGHVDSGVVRPMCSLLQSDSASTFLAKLRSCWEMGSGPCTPLVSVYAGSTLVVGEFDEVLRECEFFVAVCKVFLLHDCESLGLGVECVLLRLC